VQNQEYEKAVHHFKESLSSLQKLFQAEKDPLITTPEQAIKLIQEIELVANANLADCYN